MSEERLHRYSCDRCGCVYTMTDENHTLLMKEFKKPLKETEKITFLCEDCYRLRYGKKGRGNENLH